MGCSTLEKSVKRKKAITNTEKEVESPEISRENNVKQKTTNTEISKVQAKSDKKNKNITTEYKKKQTESIMQTIEKLEQCYDTGNFVKWKSLLTARYKKKYNDPDFLKKQGWDAKDLKSFFYLLIKTREENGIKSLTISRVIFVNPNKAHVYVLFNGKEFPKPQHTFIKVSNSWYKGLPDEGE